MKRIGFVLGLFFMAVSSAGASAAPLFSDPKALLEYAYQPYEDDGFPEDPFELFSNQLLALIEADAERTPEGETGTMNFDPYINAQDYLDLTIALGEVVMEGERAVADVEVVNFDEVSQMRFWLVREDGTWKIDDIASLTPDYDWVLSELLTQKEP